MFLVFFFTQQAPVFGMKTATLRFGQRLQLAVQHITGVLTPPATTLADQGAGAKEGGRLVGRQGEELAPRKIATVLRSRQLAGRTCKAGGSLKSL